MSGSEASNLGYGEYPPNSNINGTFINVNNTNNPANFGSNEIPPRGLFGASCNMDAAAGIVPGICMSGGGKRRGKRVKSFKLLKQKIKNISNIYKMRYTKKQRRHIKSKISRKYRLNKHKKSRKNVSSRRSRRSRMGRRMRKMQKGGAMAELGYSDFPGSEDYAGMKLSYNETGASSGYGFHVPSGDAQSLSAMASPAPISRYDQL
uniref:Uncharacterized protein n=1 Tax=viral metagenome TaxID=1070528 RepID=A0A6C0E3Y0_9ZZZZ